MGGKEKGDGGGGLSEKGGGLVLVMMMMMMMMMMMVWWLLDFYLVAKIRISLLVENGVLKGEYRGIMSQ